MIDTRFPPQPEKTHIPLYPTHKAFLNTINVLSSIKSGDLELAIAANYQTQVNQIFLLSKGSQALLLFLKWLSMQYEQPIHVGLPAFCCPEVCQAILSAEGIPVFLESSDSLSLTTSSIHFAHQMGCKVIIWPQFFGERDCIADTELIQQLGMLFINDEAQAFPTNLSSTNDSINLFSFGHSKKLSGIGGGGLFIQNSEQANAFSKDFKHLCTAPLNYREIALYLKTVLKRKVIEFNRVFATKMNLTTPLEIDMKVLLEKKPLLHQPISIENMSDYQKNMALLMMSQYQDSYFEFSRVVDELKQAVRLVFGASALRFISSISAPSIFAIAVPSTLRYRICADLAKKGVQTTWYYYPLNRLSFLDRFPREETPNTDKIASEILILPCQWRHKLKQHSYLIQAIREIKV